MIHRLELWRSYVTLSHPRLHVTWHEHELPTQTRIFDFTTSEECDQLYDRLCLLRASERLLDPDLLYTILMEATL